MRPRDVEPAPMRLARSSRRRRGRFIEDVMSRRLITVGPETGTRYALGMAEEEGVHHLLVLLRSELVGVVCEHDLEVAGPLALVRDCMNEPCTLAPEDTLDHAARLMRERAIGSIAVVAGKHLLGIITRGDLRRAGLPPSELPTAPCERTGPDTPPGSPAPRGRGD